MDKSINHATDRIISAAKAEGDLGVQALVFAAVAATLSLNDAQACAAFIEAREQLRSRGAHLKSV